MMKLTINFKLGEPTVNGRIYPPEEFKGQMLNMVGKPITHNYEEGTDLGKITGVVFPKNGNIEVEAHVKAKDIIEGLKSGKMVCTTSGIGNVSSGIKEVKDYQLQQVSIVPAKPPLERERDSKGNK